MKVRLFVLLLLAAGFSAPVWSETPQAAPEISSTPAQLTARVIDKSKPGDRSVTVEVDIQGVEIVDPASVQEQPKAGQGHLHYKLDDGPMIATTMKKLSFHELKEGEHTVMVMLAGNDHQPLGPSQTLQFKV